MTSCWLVTGGAGFIGSNFVTDILARRDDVRIVTLDLLTYAGSLANLAAVARHPRHTFVRGNICDSDLLRDLFQQHDFSTVVHFAAESHVDRSIHGPEAFIQTNVLGTQRLLEAARAAWFSAPFTPRPHCTGRRFLHVSTDEVYGSLGPTGFFTESSSYAPNSPYSASKAASDMLVRAWHHTYGLDTVITNCSNNYGPRQHGEKLIPTIIRAALAGDIIPIYGDGRNIRDWLYVTDHCTAIEAVLERGRAGETYLVGSNNEQDNLAIAHRLCDLLDAAQPRADGTSYREQITFVADRPGHDRRYAIDASKLCREIGWQPATAFTAGLQATVDWYLAAWQASAAAPEALRA
jgi:dTDP-glucose 4,6-dehydratase